MDAINVKQQSSTEAVDSGHLRAELQAQNQNKVLEEARNTFLEAAATKFSAREIEQCGIGKSDWAAAFSMYLCGPALYKTMGHDNAQSLGKRLAVFGVAPAIGFADESQKKMQNPEELGLEGSTSALLGYGFGFLSKYFSGAGAALAVGGTAVLANDQFFSSNNQERNKFLSDLSKNIDRLGDRDLMSAARKTKDLLGPQLFSASFNLLCGTAGFTKGEILGTSAKNVFPIDRLKTVVAKEFQSLTLAPAKAVTTEGVRVPVPVEKDMHVLSMDRGDGFGPGSPWKGGPLAPVKMLSDEKMASTSFAAKLEIIEKYLYAGDLKSAYQVGNQMLKWFDERGLSHYDDPACKATYEISMCIRNIAEEGAGKWANKLGVALKNAKSLACKTDNWPLKVTPEQLASPERLNSMSLKQRVEELDLLIKAGFLKEAGELALKNNFKHKDFRVDGNIILEEMFNDACALSYGIRRGYEWATKKELDTVLKYLRIIADKKQ